MREVISKRPGFSSGSPDELDADRAQEGVALVVGVLAGGVDQLLDQGVADLGEVA